MAEDFLPQSQLPDCWNDEARINVLFAPFRDKSVNPKDWESKLQFWKNLIHDYCVYNQIYVFTHQELSKKFIKNGRGPACLNIVIEQIYKDGDIKPLHAFLQKPSESWSSWVTDNFIRKPLVWSFTKVKDQITSPDTNISYVHITVVESESQKVFDKIPINMKNKIIELMVLAKTINFKNLDQLNILLHCLYCKRKLSMKILHNKGNPITLLKFYDTNNGEINDRDVDIYTLEQSENTLLEDIEKLEKQVVKLRNDAKVYLSKSQRQSAKSCLRKKKEIEKIIDKRANTLHNVQTLLSRVEDAHTDTQIVDSYKTALSRLRATFKETGLTEESVSNTMLELEETLEIHDGIQATLGQLDKTVDSDIENELADLLENGADTTKEVAEQNSKFDADVDDIEQKLAKLDLELPAPPTNDPIKTKISL